MHFTLGNHWEKDEEQKGKKYKDQSGMEAKLRPDNGAEQQFSIFI